MLMIKNGLYLFTANSREGADSEVRGILILQDGQILGGESYVYYTGSYECTAGQWRGEITSREHTPTTRPTTERVQQIGFLGTYNDAGARIDAGALVGEQSVRYHATLRFLTASK